MEYKKDLRERGIERRGTNNGMIVFGATLSKKCERLATAMYLVTNFLSDSEPLKGHLRTLCVEMIRGSNALKAGSRVNEADVLDVLHTNIWELLSLLEIAFVAGLISEMNFTILKREFVAVRDIVDLQKASRESRTDSILSDNFFNTPESSLFASEARQSNSRGQTSTNPALDPVVADFAKSRLNQQVHVLDAAVSIEARPKQSSVPAFRTTPQGHPIGHAHSLMSDRNVQGQKKVSPVERRVVGRRTDHSVSRAEGNVAIQSRRVRILKLIKDNREVMIKDIVKHFPDLSEKTIQRELLSFVESGVLKKLGERRWSRYSLA